MKVVGAMNISVGKSCASWRCMRKSIMTLIKALFSWEISQLTFLIEHIPVCKHNNFIMTASIKLFWLFLENFGIVYHLNKPQSSSRVLYCMVLKTYDKINKWYKVQPIKWVWTWSKRRDCPRCHISDNYGKIS